MVSLDKVDQRILFELDKNARIPETKLAKLVRKSKESVRYRIKKLQEQDVIQGFTTWVDPTRLGFTTAKIYLRLANIPSKKREFIQFVKKDKRLFWLGIADGAWDAGLTYFIKSNREFFDLKNELFSKFKNLILESDTGMVVDINTSYKTFFYKEKNIWTTMFDHKQHYQLSSIEKRILRELFENARARITQIAQKLNTTVDIVRNRIKNLEKQKVITRYLAKIDYTKINVEFFKTFLYFKNLTKQDEVKLMQYCLMQPKIVHLVRMVSPWDVELEIMCKNYQEYKQIISDLTKEFSSTINKVETAIMGEDYVFPAKKMVFED